MYLHCCCSIISRFYCSQIYIWVEMFVQIFAYNCRQRCMNILDISNARNHTLQKCKYLQEFREIYRVIKLTASIKDFFWHKIHAKYLITIEYLLFQISVSFSGASSNTKMMMHKFAEIQSIIAIYWEYRTVKEALVFICKGCEQHISLQTYF